MIPGAPAILCLVFIAFCCGHMWRAEQAPMAETAFPAPYSAEELKATEIVDFTRAMEIRLRIVDFPTFIAERGSATNALAFTYSTKTPCEIVLPEGMMIALNPQWGGARFARSHDAETVAHEIMHCVRGAWHPEQSGRGR